MLALNALILTAVAQISVTGQVLDPEGRPVAGVQVRAGPNGGGKTIQANISSDGHFFLTLISATSVFCEISAPGYDTTRELAIVSNGTARLGTLRLKPQFEMKEPKLIPIGNRSGTAIQVSLVNKTTKSVNLVELTLQGGLIGQRRCAEPQGSYFRYSFTGELKGGAVQVEVGALGLGLDTSYEANGTFRQNECGGEFMLTATNLLALPPGALVIELQIPQALPLQSQSAPTGGGKLFIHPCQKDCVEMQIRVLLDNGGQVASLPVHAIVRVER